jgi:hypothetical protein
MRTCHARTGLALAVVLALGAVGPASAAVRPKPKPKPVCNLITDATKDTFAFRSQDQQGMYGPQEDALDIVSGDIASNGVTLTGVLRVVKLATSVGTAPNGIDFRVNFALPGQDPAVENFFLNARADRAGTQKFLLGHITRTAPNVSTTVKLADGTGVFDLKRNEVRISAPLKAVTHGSFTLAPKMKISLGGLDQTDARQVAVNPSSDIGTAVFADVANSEKTYVEGTPSCVIPGK